MLEISRDVPPPTEVKGANRKYPFRELEPGDSFFAPSRKGVGLYRSLQVSCAYYGRALNRRFTVKAVDGGYRCWRLADAPSVFD